ncbi:helix-turn-helix domain-containing protein [Neobacillus sp. LXY-4]|uniref:helix-turn-helix domain-containing protein n=1 Tax=Neobacillus sp. LXY-4 TaxID=3379826 RepID=UPI003EE1CD84
MGTIGQNIKLCRERQNMSQQELARRIRVGTRTVEKFETDLQKPDTQTILNISTVLDTPASELLEQEYQSHYSTFDRETENLLNEIGTKKAKLFLTRIKDLNEKDLLSVIAMLDKLNHNNENSHLM